VEFWNAAIFAGALLLVIAIVSSAISSRFGAPLVLVFIAIGMLAGEEGPGGIQFDDFELSYVIGTLALAVIIFDGGLRTRRDSFRVALWPAASLATVGVVLTAALVGVFAARMLDLGWVEGLLLGSIVASTDAAAVFALLRHAGLTLKERVAATLEIESASNDPMAIFLTVGLLEIITTDAAPGLWLLWLFAQQMGVGALVGLALGAAGVFVINRINLAAMGLYPVLAGACGLLAFGLAAVLGGSGFLAIYLAGIVLGNSRLVFQRGTFLFMDGLAWIGQIAMFVVLGLLSTPTDVIAIAGPALLIAAVLILVARPLAVAPFLWPFGFTVREQVLVSWVGLKGAVPIILATFPMIAGVDQARLLFNVVFFVVLVSATLQGWTLAPLAGRLGLQEPAPASPQVSLELLALHDVDAEVLDCAVDAQSPLVGRAVSALALPDGALLALIARNRTLVAPRGPTTIAPGDHLFVITPRRLRDDVDRALRH